MMGQLIGSALGTVVILILGYFMRNSPGGSWDDAYSCQPDPPEKIKPPPRTFGSIGKEAFTEVQTRANERIKRHNEALAAIGREPLTPYKRFNAEGDVVTEWRGSNDPPDPKPLAYTIDHMIEESEKIQDIIALENPKLWAANQAARTYKKTMGDDNRERFYK